MANPIYILHKIYADKTIPPIIVCAFTKRARAFEKRELMNDQRGTPKVTYSVEAINLYSDDADLDDQIDTNENRNRRRTIDHQHPVEITDDTPVNLTQLAKVMNMGVSTIYKFRSLGYQVEFGIRTTPGHFKKWLREYYEKKRQEEQAELKAGLDRLE